MNPTIEEMQQHCSIRKFADRELETGTLKQLLLAGQAAATSSFIQATTVIQVTDLEIRSRMVDISGNQKYVRSAAEFLVFCADLQRIRHRVKALGLEAEFDWTEQFITATIDVALFAQNTVIAAESLGLGCCYIGGIRNQPEDVCQLLGLPDLVYPVFGLCIGYPAQSPGKKPRLPLPAIVHQNSYQALGDTDQSIDHYDQDVSKYYDERTAGKRKTGWSEQMMQQAERQTRSFMLNFLHKRGLLRR